MPILLVYYREYLKYPIFKACIVDIRWESIDSNEIFSKLYII